MTTKGINFRMDPEFINRIRQLGFKDIEEYLAFAGYDKEESEKKFQEEDAVTSKHEVAKRIQAIKPLGGGQDFSGVNEPQFGGFGSPKELNG